jgi:hypothetical protein
MAHRLGQAEWDESTDELYHSLVINRTYKKEKCMINLAAAE